MDLVIFAEIIPNTVMCHMATFWSMTEHIDDGGIPYSPNV